MEVALRDKERVGMCIIGEHYFTYDEPGPKDIDLASLSQSELNQLVYNARRGVLAVGNPKELVEFAEGLPAAAKSYSTDKENPPPEKIPVKDVLEEDLKELRELLRSSVSSIKRQLGPLPPGRIRKLLELELEGKNRKGLISHLNEMLAKHADAVVNEVGDQDVDNKRTGVPPLGSMQVTDVVESEVEQIVMNPLGEEDG